MKQLSDNLLTRLTQADICCRDCGMKYGSYSVGCSSVWEAECDVCGERKPITETRDYGYLTKGINELKGTVKEQSKGVADYLLSVGPIMNDDELDGIMTASYEEGELTCKFTEAELTALAEVLNAHEEEHPPGWSVDYDSAFEKVMELYGDNCVKYELSPALRKYNEIYGTWGHENDEEQKRWDIFREAFVAGVSLNREGVQ